MEHALGAVGRLEHDVGLREPVPDVASAERADLEQGASLDRLVGIEQRLAQAPLDVDQRDRGLCLGERVGAHGGDRGAFVVAFRGEQLGVAGADDATNAGGRECGREVDLLGLGARVRAAKHRCLEHPGETDVAGVQRLAAGARIAVEACSGSADHIAGAVRPLIERVLVDDEPDLLELALDLLLRTDQSCHVRIASSIFGYVPQRHRLPAIRWRISSLEGSGELATSAAALTICPGVQNPH